MYQTFCKILCVLFSSLENILLKNLFLIRWGKKERKAWYYFGHYYYLSCGRPKNMLIFCNCTNKYTLDTKKIYIQYFLVLYKICSISLKVLTCENSKYIIHIVKKVGSPTPEIWIRRSDEQRVGPITVTSWKMSHDVS